MDAALALTIGSRSSWWVVVARVVTTRTWAAVLRERTDLAPFYVNEGSSDGGVGHRSIAFS